MSASSGKKPRVTPRPDWTDTNDWVFAEHCPHSPSCNIAGVRVDYMAVFGDDSVRYRTLGFRFSVGHSGERDE